MPASASPLPESVVVTRLRAAGCVFAEDEAQLLMAGAATLADLSAMVDRRAAGEPLEHVLGWAEFCGLRIAVDPGVFVPRRRTEFLVSQAITLARQAARPVPATPVHRPARSRPAAGWASTPITPANTAATPANTAATPARTVVVDLCCGSGALGVALATALGEVELYAADLDPAAVRCARRNVAAVGGQVYQGDLYEPLPATLRGRVDILIANAPYVPTEEVGLLPPEARLHEPQTSLDGGADGLDILRLVAAGAPRWLIPGGHLLMETSERQAPLLAEAVTRAGLFPRVARSTELSATLIIATRPAPGEDPG
jgi:release factor glutamine methyltransferase